MHSPADDNLGVGLRVRNNKSLQKKETVGRRLHARQTGRPTDRVPDLMSKRIRERESEKKRKEEGEGDGRERERVTRREREGERQR